jgi:hypothetical protein
MSDKRTFTIHHSNVGYVGGHYKSTSVAGAAKKAASILFRLAENKKGKKEWKKYEKKVSSVHFTIRETTVRSDKKQHSYTGTKEKLAKPVILKEGTDDEYKIEHKINLVAKKH